MIEIIDQIEQGSEAWFIHRLASIGGSSISKAVAGGSGATRSKLMYDFVGELLSGEKKDSYSSQYMQMGTDNEPEARLLYEFETGNEVAQVGLIKNGDYKHYSPDGLVGIAGILEIKCCIPSVWAERKLTGKIPTEYRKQMQWGLYICEKEWCDFVVYSPFVKVYPLIIQQVERDEKEIKELADGADKFIAEMLEMYNKVKV